MGLFGRSRAEREEVSELRSDLVAIQERLVESVRANTALEERLRAVDSTNAELASEVAALRTSNAELGGRLAAVDDLSAHVEDLDARLIAPPTQPPPPPGSPGSADHAGGDEGRPAPDADGLDADAAADPRADTVTHADTDADRAAIEERLSTLSERVTALDERITSISTELANQLTELGNELDALGERGTDAAGIDDEALTATVERAIGAAVDEIRGGQERLAAEQARYQIQFREDLAEVAERLRRPSRDR